MVSTDLQTHMVSLSEIGLRIRGVDMEDTQNNTLGQLNIELFAQLHRLREVDVSDEAALKAEIERSKAVEGISHNIIDNAKVIMDATKMRSTFSQQTTVPRMLEG